MATKAIITIDASQQKLQKVISVMIWYSSKVFIQKDSSILKSSDTFQIHRFLGHKAQAPWVS